MSQAPFNSVRHAIEVARRLYGDVVVDPADSTHLTLCLRAGIYGSIGYEEECPIHYLSWRRGHSFTVSTHLANGIVHIDQFNARMWQAPMAKPTLCQKVRQAVGEWFSDRKEDLLVAAVSIGIILALFGLVTLCTLVFGSVSSDIPEIIPYSVRHPHHPKAPAPHIVPVTHPVKKSAAPEHP